jgi:hypothetical protein
MVPRNSNHPWRIRIVVMVMLAASVGLVEAIQASMTGTAGRAAPGNAVVASKHFKAEVMEPSRVASRAAASDHDPSPIAGK